MTIEIVELDKKQSANVIAEMENRKKELEKLAQKQDVKSLAGCFVDANGKIKTISDLANEN